MHAYNWHKTRIHCLQGWVWREYFPSLHGLKHSDSGDIWKPRNSFKNLPSELGESNRFWCIMDSYELSNQHTRLQSHTAPSHGPSSFIAKFLFEDKEAQSLIHNLTQLSSSEIHACSCPNGTVVFFFKTWLCFLFPSWAQRKSNRWHISTNVACLFYCKYMQRSRKLSPTLQGQSCDQENAIMIT